jgi:hypothetical protein
VRVCVYAYTISTNVWRDVWLVPVAGDGVVNGKCVDAQALEEEHERRRIQRLSRRPCFHPRARTHTHTYTHAQTDRHTHTHTRTCSHMARIPTHTHVRIRVSTHAFTHVHNSQDIHTCMHAYMPYIYIHACMHTCHTYTYMHACIHAIYTCMHIAKGKKFTQRCDRRVKYFTWKLICPMAVV